MQLQNEIHASSELYYTFPRYKILSTSHENIPTLIIPNSKYSSTETEFSSDSEETNDWNGKDCQNSGPRLSVSPSPFGTFQKRKWKRKRKFSNASSGSGSSRAFSDKSAGFRQSSNDSIDSVWNGGINIQKQKSFLTPVSSVKDLNHAIGRHRGLSGSFTPSVDAALFSMFYTTDVFDGLISNNAHVQRYFDSHNACRRRVVALLRKEIIYSLRMSYYCPGSKVVKLIELLKEYHLTDFQDISGVFGMFFGRVLCSAPFFRLSNGSTGFIQRLAVESSYHKLRHNPSQTIQRLLYTKGKSSVDQIRFQTVPYPVLIIELVRKGFDGGQSDSYSSSEPVVPNLEIDITDLISRMNDDTLYSSCDSFTNSFMTSTTVESEKSFLAGHDKGQGKPESRFYSTLKSAWRVMFQYLEDFASSTSSHLSPEPTLSESMSNASVVGPSAEDKYPHIFYESLPRVSYSSNRGGNGDLTSSLSSTSSWHPKSRTSLNSPQPEVRLELIGVICLTRSKSKNNFTSTSSGHFSGYSVYCKAGRDKETQNESLYAPWVLYQPRNGVAPQVTLIENFGKWVNSLERKYESFSLHEVPLEIRRVLQDSKLLIYRRND